MSNPETPEPLSFWEQILTPALIGGITGAIVGYAAKQGETTEAMIGTVVVVGMAATQHFMRRYLAQFSEADAIRHEDSNVQLVVLLSCFVSGMLLTGT